MFKYNIAKIIKLFIGKLLESSLKLELLIYSKTSQRKFLENSDDEKGELLNFYASCCLI